MALYFQSYHDDQAQTLVLLHGGGLSSKQWQPQIDCLSGFHLLLPDLPEQGKTGGQFDLVEAAQQVAELIAAHAHDGKAHVVGLSLGGAVVLELLRSHPDRVLTALVTGTSAKLSPMLGRIMIWTADVGRLFSAQWMTNAGIKQFGIEQYRDLVYDDLLRSTDPGFNKRVAHSLMALELPTQTGVLLLVLVGEKETPAAKSAAKQLFEQIPTASAATVPGVGHVWNLQNPALFCEVVRLWATQQQIASALQPF